jgi:tRNA uridine 5-carbamoylmethylation protein Kti12
MVKRLAPLNVKEMVYYCDAENYIKASDLALGGLSRTYRMSFGGIIKRRCSLMLRFWYNQERRG